MKKVCLFCAITEDNKPNDIEFVCSSCVQLLVNQTQEDLKKAYAKAIEKNYPGKAEAIRMFLTSEIEGDESNGKRPSKKQFKRSFTRGGAVRIFRGEKISS